MSKVSIEAWAFIAPETKVSRSAKSDQRQVLADSTFVDENHAWQIGLGWPSKGEIEDAKKRGYRVARVRIEEIE